MVVAPSSRARNGTQNGRCSDAVSLTIADDGLGFQPGQAINGHGHFGLTGMRTRAQTIGGDLSIRSAPGAGTTIRIVVPLPAPN